MLTLEQERDIAISLFDDADKELENQKANYQRLYEKVRELTEELDNYRSALRQSSQDVECATIDRQKKIKKAYKLIIKCDK